MAGGAGFIIDMNNKIKENQALRKKRKRFFEKDNYYHQKASEHKIDVQTASPEEIEIFQKNLKNLIKKTRLMLI